MISIRSSRANMVNTVRQMRNSGHRVRLNVCPELYDMIPSKMIVVPQSNYKAEVVSEGWKLVGNRHFYFQNGMVIDGWFAELI